MRRRTRRRNLRASRLMRAYTATGANLGERRTARGTSEPMLCESLRHATAQRPISERKRAKEVRLRDVTPAAADVRTPGRRAMRVVVQRLGNQGDQIDQNMRTRRTGRLVGPDRSLFGVALDQVVERPRGQHGVAEWVKRAQGQRGADILRPGLIALGDRVGPGAGIEALRVVGAEHDAAVEPRPT